MTIRSAFERIERWLNDNGAESIVANLAAGADDQALDRFSARIGHALPADLRELWSVHDGQHEEGDGFYSSYDLFGTTQADQDVRLFLPFLREPKSAHGVEKSGMTALELASDAWIRIAGRDSDGIAVQLETGRVFAIWHDDFPALQLLASSISAWISKYADEVTADDYLVEEGFGGVYLEKRDRRAEARTAEREVGEKRRATLSSAEAIDLAISKNSETILLQALYRAEDKSQFIELLFAKGSPAFIAMSLRPKLTTLTLSAAQWQIVAKGAKELGNNALLSLAERKQRPS